MPKVPGKTFLPDSEEQGTSDHVFFEVKALVSTTMASINSSESALAIALLDLGSHFGSF